MDGAKYIGSIADLASKIALLLLVRFGTGAIFINTVHKPKTLDGRTMCIKITTF